MDSSDPRLIPQPCDGQKAQNARTSLFTVTPACLQAWLQLPCYRMRTQSCSPEWEPQVADVVNAWQQQHHLRLDLPAIVHHTWAPLAVTILHQQWSILGVIPPLLDRSSQRRQQGMWNLLFGHLHSLQRTAPFEQDGCCKLLGKSPPRNNPVKY